MVRLKRSNNCPVRSLKLDEIRTDGDTQPRVTLDDQLVREYAELYEAETALPPIVVFHDGSHYWLADGFHRYHAARQANLARLECEVHKGTVDEARWYACAANQTHGQRRTNEDKRRAVLLALKHPKGAGLSDRQIAEHVGVTHPFVGKIRSEASNTGNDYQSPTRIGRDGRTIDTTNIGRRASVEHPDEAQPDTHPAIMPVAEEQEDDSPVDELGTILWSDYVMPAITKWWNDWEGATFPLAAAVVENKIDEIRNQ